MKLFTRVFSIGIILSIGILAVGCSKGSNLQAISAKQALKLSNKNNVVIVAAQVADTAVYEKEHVKNAIKINLSDIVIDKPVVNMLAPKEQIEKVMGGLGISNDTTVIVYDANNNMDAARVWWTLKVYGHENVKVVSGGLSELKKAGAEITKDVPEIKPATYVAKEKNTNMIATLDQVKAQVTTPDKNTVLLDTRSPKEYSEGTIPGSILSDYINNNYSDGTYKAAPVLKTLYVDKKIKVDNCIIIYCKTSIRGAQSYLALYDAGYTNLKLYDGAFVEWSSQEGLPIQKSDAPADSKTPVTPPPAAAQDAS